MDPKYPEVGTMRRQLYLRLWLGAIHSFHVPNKFQEFNGSGSALHCVWDNGSSPFCEHLYVLTEYLKQISLEDVTDIMSYLEKGE